MVVFDVHFSSNMQYPEHQLEVVLRNVDFNAVPDKYRVPGNKVPCTLSLLFLNIGTRSR